MEQKQRTRMLVEAGLSIAIAYVLHFVVLFQMPQGGSVNAAVYALFGALQPDVHYAGSAPLCRALSYLLPMHRPVKTHGFIL